MTRQAPRWPLLTPHRENLRLQRRSSSDRPSGGHTRAFLQFCAKETTAAVGAEAPILFHGPIHLVPLARIHAARQCRTGSGRFLELRPCFRTLFSHASLSLRCRILARCSLGVRSEFKGVFLFVRSLFARSSAWCFSSLSPRYLPATGSRQFLDS